MPVPPPSNAKKVFEGSLASAYQWNQEMFDGSERMFECYVRPDTATVIPFLDRDTVLLTKQDQPARQTFWDFPGGRVDTGETLEQGARRELHEETGYRPGELVLWEGKTHTGLIRYEQGLFLAKQLVHEPMPNVEENGERIELVPTKWSELVQRCLRGDLRQPDVMLAVVAMEYEPEAKARLAVFLSDLP
ncbi:MAG: NUDIX hydrolase, partial [Candidatus Uhrbacteria bacterium]|nr:NUDIX hydrolase [Candidatus Uhrbacteria bacterium]